MTQTTKAQAGERCKCYCGCRVFDDNSISGLCGICRQGSHCTKPPAVSPGWICGHCGADNLHTTGRLTCRVCRYGRGRSPLPMPPKPAPQVVTCGYRFGSRTCALPVGHRKAHRATIPQVVAECATCARSKMFADMGAFGRRLKNSLDVDSCRSLGHDVRKVNHGK